MNIVGRTALVAYAISLNREHCQLSAQEVGSLSQSTSSVIHLRIIACYERDTPKQTHPEDNDSVATVARREKVPEPKSRSRPSFSCEELGRPKHVSFGKWPQRTATKWNVFRVGEAAEAT